MGTPSLTEALEHSNQSEQPTGVVRFKGLQVFLYSHHAGGLISFWGIDRFVSSAL